VIDYDDILDVPERRRETQQRSLIQRICIAAAVVLWCFMLCIIIVTAVGAAELPFGWTNPEVSKDNLDETICKSGWTKTIRPPVGYTNALKRMQMRSYELKGEPQDYEEDHYIPLELGGHPFDTRNLRPQAYKGKDCGARIKDLSESAFKRAVCAGEKELEEAQLEFAKKWENCFDALRD
jgi:hypothetical protein